MQADLFERADEYLHGKMTEEEKIAFEAELAADVQLSSDVNLYKKIEVEMREHYASGTNAASLKNSLQNLNKAYFKPEPLPAAKIVPLHKKPLFTFVASIAASLIAAAIIYFAFFPKTSGTKQMAGNYINEHLTVLSQTMDGSRDSLQQGIAAYNNKEYQKALQLFRGVDSHHPGNSYVKRDIGLVYLVTKDYDRALQEFNELAEMKRLFSNPGMFLKAVTLMQRNKNGDQQQAKILLQKVATEKAEGSREAEEWLKNW